MNIYKIKAMTKYKIIKFYRIFFILYGSVYISKAICLLATAPFCPIHIIFTVHYVVPILCTSLLQCSQKGYFWCELFHSIVNCTVYSVDTVETGKGPSPGKDKSYESSVAIFNIIYLGGASPQGDRF